MKKLITTTSIMILTILSSLGQEIKSPTFSFREETWDFGIINQGTPVSHKFVFTNNSDVPIVINGSSASCGCTTPTYPTEPILPGKSGEIEVQYNAANIGGFNKSITILSNAEPNTKLLFIKGEVQMVKDDSGTYKKPSEPNK